MGLSLLVQLSPPLSRLCLSLLRIPLNSFWRLFVWFVQKLRRTNLVRGKVTTQFFATVTVKNGFIGNVLDFPKFILHLPHPLILLSVVHTVINPLSTELSLTRRSLKELASEVAVLKDSVSYLCLSVNSSTLLMKDDATSTTTALNIKDRSSTKHNQQPPSQSQAPAKQKQFTSSDPTCSLLEASFLSLVLFTKWQEIQYYYLWS